MTDQDEHAQDDNRYGLEDFAQPSDDCGFSLEALSTAYAELVTGGNVPYESPPAEEPAREPDSQAELEGEDPHADLYCEVTPASILESMLFVGNPQNEPLMSSHVASLMRGVRPHEIDQLVEELNAQYEQQGCPYRIVSVGAGYSLQLSEQYAALRDKFYGRVREARLSQAAIDILAIVAYRQGLTREEIEQLRGRPSGSVLLQLVRRQLLQIERPQEKPRQARYYTTDRFLSLFGLASIEELPQANDVDKSF